MKKSSDAPAIEVESLRKTYRDGLFGGRRVEALKGVSFQVRRGEIYGLLGPNGAGKTTMIKVLLGVVRKSGGTATLLGWPAGDRRGRRSVGYLPESHRIPRHHTGNTALEYYGSLSGVSYREIRRRTPELLRSVGLQDWGRTSVRKYSKGMQQRLGLAQALMHDPEVLILDEPTDGVDPVGRSEMRALLKRLKDEGKTIFLNSHLLQEIELVCDRVAILDRGSMRREASVAELTTVQQDDVVLKLVAAEPQARSVLREAAIVGCAPCDDGQLEVSLRVPDQAVLDACVDRLRAAGISIVSISRRRQTLEAAFLEIVGNHGA